MGLFLSLVSILLPSLLFLFSLSLSLANLATRGAFGHESHLSGEYIHDGRALIGYPSVGEAPSKEGRFFVKKITGFEGPNVT